MQVDPSAALGAAAPIIEALRSADVRFYVGGSLASSAFGVPRSTVDVDLVAELREEHVPALLAAVGDACYVDEGAVRRAIRGRSSFNLIHLETMLKIDVFIMKNTAHGRTAAERSVIRSLPGSDNRSGGDTYPFAAPEDVILSKLEWYRLGDELSERQWLDVIGVLRVQDGHLDGAYLDRWAAELNVADLLARARRDAAIYP